MTFIPMPAAAGAHICSEGNGSISREPITLKSGNGVLVAGSVLGRITAAGADFGKYGPYNNAAADGRQAAAGVLFAGVDTTSADARGVGHVRLCEVYASRLAWASGTSDADKTAAYADLAAANIIARA